MKNKRQFCTVAAAAFFLNSCGVSRLPPRLEAEKSLEIIAQEADALGADNRHAHVEVDKRDSPVLIGKSDYIPNEEVYIPQNAVDINLGVPLPVGDVLRVIAEAEGWSVEFAGQTDQSVPVRPSLANVAVDEALEKIAAEAGYTVITDQKTRSVIVAATATWTFRLPPNLSDNIAWNYSVGGDPSETFRSQGGGEGGGLSGLSANSEVSGSVQQQSNIGEYLTAVINAGEDEGVSPAAISIQPLRGIVAVTGNHRQLRRAAALIAELMRESTTRVELNAAIVEVNLSDQTEIGINWTKILNDKRDPASQIQLTGRTLSENASFVTSITKRTISFVLNSLDETTNFRVITRPNLVLDNHSPADLVDANVVPYLAEVNSELDSDGNVAYSASSAQAVDGLKISVIPHVISHDQVQLRLLPFLGSVPSFETFSYGDGGRLTLPNQTSKQALLSITMQDGETLLLAGNRVTTRNRGNRGIPGMSTPLTDSEWDEEGATEVAILLSVKILPPPHIPILLNKTI